MYKKIKKYIYLKANKNVLSYWKLEKLNKESFSGMKVKHFLINNPVMDFEV